MIEVLPLVSRFSTDCAKSRSASPLSCSSGSRAEFVPRVFSYAIGLWSIRPRSVRPWSNRRLLRLREMSSDKSVEELERENYHAGNRRCSGIDALTMNSHFNLALVDERRGMLADAENEALASLLLNPAQADAHNLLAVIHAEKGETFLAWSELAHETPDYEPASANLAILGSLSKVAIGETTSAGPPPSGRRPRHYERPLTSPGCRRSAAHNRSGKC
jgi:hypothetical protein